MDNKIKVSIIVLVVLIIAMVFFNQGDFTGKVISTPSIVTINPDVISAGEYLEITGIPSKNGLSKKFYICDDGAFCRWHTTMKTCEGYKCTIPFSARYKTTSLESGVYYLKFYDYTLDDYIKAYFTVA